MWLTKGPTNLEKAYDFTDWEKVNVFSKKLLDG